MAAPGATEPEVFKRLPRCVSPTHYSVEYDLIDLLNFRFEGSERVALRVNEATSVITCHAVELYVFDVSVEDAASSWKTQQAQELHYHKKHDSVSFYFAEPLVAGSLVTLRLQFHGVLNDQLRGFYRTEYEHEGEKRVLAVTQFEACDARRAFVCWDEPALKATFEISMVTETNLVALSNAHVVETLVRPKKHAHLRTNSRSHVDRMEKVWKFARSPVMSTYLVAMVVGEFDLISDLTSEGVVINVYTAPGQSARGRFALNVATKALSFFTQRFNIPYPLKKLDMVAIPDFMGAMENWGLVTYTETFLLVDATLSSHEIKADAARAICHELSHQWFGNLVTMEWWTGLWLNEGFAQFMDMADTWTKQVGFPLVTVTQNDNGTCTLVQERFFADRCLNSSDNTVWDIPLTIITSDDPTAVKRLGIWDAKTVSSESSIAVTTPLVASDAMNEQVRVPAGLKGWVKLNPNQTGFYLVNYSPALWKRLQLPVKEQLLGVPDRVSLLNSAFAFARSGLLHLSVALDFTSAYVDESASLCWKEISHNMAYYSNLFRDEVFYPKFQQYLRTLFAHAMKRLGWDPDPSKPADADEGEFRKTVIHRLGLAGDEEVIKEAKKRFSAYMGGEQTALSGDLRGAVFHIEVMYGDASSATLLQELHNKSDFAEESTDCLNAMGSVAGAAAKLQVLEWAIENVRAQNIHYPFMSVANDKLGAQVAWQFVQDKWDVLATKYSAMTLGYILCGVVSRFQSEAMCVEVEAFVVDKDTAGYKRRLTVALEGARLKSAVFCRDREPLAMWLKERAV
ncbi:hypothetical protein PsorP6_011799 [Peronosclerospora sorghi]|uniref:Uncharacterized protein n=1 Tax=Peronosclerospora sorghi TaxID=230839 RepID=A0ACC0WLN2_9STRA|nr:hypothetical protein PsorP6_011799 [Peronosclerospora sorghi]